MSLTLGLQKDYELFSTSIKLKSVATGLKKIVEGKQIKKEKKNFEWGGNLISQMDLDSKHYHKKEHPELCVVATKLRPRFYRALLRFRIPFDTNFSKGIYETLKSYGENVQLNEDELKQAGKIFQSMAEDTLLELQYSHRIGQI